MSGSEQSKAAPTDLRLPNGFTVALDRRARRLDGGATLLGGSPGRLLRLTPTAVRLLADAGPGGPGLVVRDATTAALARRLLDAGLAHPVPQAITGAPTPAQVTLVVPVRDRPDHLHRLLASVAAITPGLAAVIVVDDGSLDAAACRTAGHAHGATVLRHPASRGPAAARNTGLAAARTTHVAFLDSDVVPLPGWLDPLAAHLADPAVALAAPRVVALPSPRPGWLDRYEQLRSSLDLGPEPSPVLPRSRVAYVPSAALLVRRDAVEGGFAEDMRVAEDVDLGLRLHEAGWRLRYEPAARVAHEHRARPLDWWSRKAFYGTGAAPLAVRHPGAVPPLVLAPWSAAVAVLVGLQRPRALLAAAAVTGVAGLRLRRTLRSGRAAGGQHRTAALLVGYGLVNTANQAAGVLTRHWWPVAAAGCLVSGRVRRAVLLAAVAEGLVDRHRHPPGPGEPGLDPLRYLLAHRLDDLGYGAGLWLGAARHRTAAPLLPVISGLARPSRLLARARRRPVSSSPPA
jgi:mycofactocin system glycosyltransferase